MNTQPQMPVLPPAEPWIPEDCAEAARQQVLSSFIGPGAASQKFADGLAAKAGVMGAVPMASGTVALSVAAQLLGLKPGDEVIVPAYAVISVINGFAAIGLKPRLADIHRSTGCLDPDLLEEAITPATRAVCFVDFCASIGPELDQVAAICAGRGIPLIEDAAWALGRVVDGKRGGATGTVGALSFSVPKIITTGQGGALLVNSAEHQEAAIAAVDQGDANWRKTNLNHGIGSNLRLSDLAAAVGQAQLDRLDERLARKGAAYAVLKDILGERLFEASDGGWAFQYIVFAEDPAEFIAPLRAQGILAAQHYRPLWEHPPFKDLRDRPLEGAAFWGRHAVYLPSGVAMTENDAERVARAVAGSNARLVNWR
jgi:perosamine synthetase